MHNSIELTADTEIQLRDVVVNKRFIEFLHLLTGLTNAVHKNLHRRGQAFPRCGL